MVNEAVVGINPPADVSFDRITGAPLALESQLDGSPEVETDSTPPADETANVAGLAFQTNAAAASALGVLSSSTGRVATISPDGPGTQLSGNAIVTELQAVSVSDATNASSSSDGSRQTPAIQIADNLFSTNDWIDAI